MVLQTVQERISMLVQSKYMQLSEAVLQNPILFGDYRTAKSVSTCYHAMLIWHVPSISTAFLLLATLKQLACPLTWHGFQQIEVLHGVGRGGPLV